MKTTSVMTKIIFLNSVFLLLPSSLCHMEMSWPYPLRSKFNPTNGYDTVDYSMTSPLAASGSNYPCKGYHHNQAGNPVVTYTAGERYNITLAGSATHGGGSCQISLSYDNGSSFQVIKSMIGGCPSQHGYEFTVPSYAPSGHALLAWTWQNKQGNREYYMNCAEVEIIPSDLGATERRQDAAGSFSDLPAVWKANMPAVTACTTTEGEDPVYPNPGPDVEYADGFGRFSDPTPGQCDSPTSGEWPTGGEDAYPPFPGYGPDQNESFSSASRTLSRSRRPSSQTRASELLGDTYTDGSAATGISEYADDSYTEAWRRPASSTTILGPRTASLSPTRSEYSTMSTQTTFDFQTQTPFPLQTGYVSEDVQGPFIYQTQAQRLQQAIQSTTTVTIDCDPTTVTVIVSQSTSGSVRSPATYTASAPIAACTASSAQCPCAAGYGCYGIGVCTWACVAAGATSARSGFDTITSIPQSVAARPTSTSRSSSSPNPVASPTANSPRPPYETGDVNRYLPCAPGTFICASNTTFYTCDHNDGSATGAASADWVYVKPRQVSAGMECLTNLSPQSKAATSQGQQVNVAAGYYRDDRVVRARPNGDCNNDGSMRCTDGGSSFEVCDQGGWVDMGSVAAGTVCQDGRMVAV